MATKSEQDWQAESDARTLQEAEAIKTDQKRMGRAQEAAKKMLKEEQAKADALKRLANAKIEYSKSPEPPKEQK